MEKLGKDWITDGLIDFEYKKYLMLAYMQHVDANFSATKLYPVLGELVHHYNNLIKLKRSKDSLSNDFPKTLAQIDLIHAELGYASGFHDSNELKCIEEIMEFALPFFEERIETGKSIYEFVEEQLIMKPVGIMPIYRDEGYVMLEDSSASDVLVYQYKSSIIESSTEKYRSLKTRFLFRERKSISNSVDTIKSHLIDRFRELPNPATWLVRSEFRIPLVETFLPVTKRILMRELYQ